MCAFAAREEFSNLSEDIAPDAGLNALPEDLYPCGVVGGACGCSHDGLDLVEAEEAWSVGGFYEWSGINLVIALWDGWNLD